MTTTSQYVQHPQGNINLDTGMAAVGGILFSVVATTVTISFFLSGLKQAIAEVNSRINQISIESKASNDQILLRMTYKDEALRDLQKKYERMECYLRGITHHAEFDE